jgi:hypothetical protein
VSRRAEAVRDRVRRAWGSTPLGRFEPTAAAELRVHALLAAFGGYVLAFALQRTVTYRELALPTPTDLLWPLFWADRFAWRTVALGLTTALVAAAVAGVTAYRHRPARMVLALLLTVFVAALSGFGKINHGLHHLVLAVVVLALVPTLPRALLEGVPRPRLPAGAYDLVAAAQGLVLVTYTLSGAAKLLAGVAQLRAGEPNLFSSGSLSRLVAERMLQTGESPPLAGVILERPLLGALLYGATVVIELLAVLVLPWPRLAAGWAAALAAFHLAVFWSMHINFTPSIAVLVLLFGLSPFLARGPSPPPAAAGRPADPGSPEGAGSLPGSDTEPTPG